MYQSQFPNQQYVNNTYNNIKPKREYDKNNILVLVSIIVILGLEALDLLVLSFSSSANAGPGVGGIIIIFYPFTLASAIIAPIVSCILSAITLFKNKLSLKIANLITIPFMILEYLFTIKFILEISNYTVYTYALFGTMVIEAILLIISIFSNNKGTI